MKHILDVEVSAFTNAMATKPYSVNLYEWITSADNKILVEKIRNESDADKKAQLKKQLSCITPSGKFSNRSKDGLLKHSGFICIDIDMKPNLNVDNFNVLKSLIMELECVAYCSLSASGKGYFALIPISYPSKHREHFESLKMDFSLCGIEIDASCSDVSRLRFASYDEEPYINLNATPYNKIIPTKTVYKARPLNSIMKKEDTRKSVEDLIDIIEQMEIDITENYDDWLKIGFGIANEFGENGRDYFHRVSQFNLEYDVDEANMKYSSCLKSKAKDDKPQITIATLFHYAQKYGVIQSAIEKDFGININRS